MDNLSVYNQVRAVPKEALKEIQAGRLKGKSDINPMWRIKALTEQFGMCGMGWKYVITKQWLEAGGKDEISAFVNIDLFIKVDGVWSDAIPGTGGSSFVANESRGPYMSDECFKMALTDAISVSCKALGFAADVYWNSDSTKYNKPPQQPTKLAEVPKAQSGVPPKAEPPKEQPTTAEPSTPIDGPTLPTNTLRQFHAIRGQLGKTEEDFKFALTQAVGFEVASMHDLARLTEPKLAELIKALQDTVKQRTEGSPDSPKCGCGMVINKAVQTFSVQKYGKPLCRDCQGKQSVGA